jgi:uncharacterized protein YpiB (UPF0302 family)
MSKWVSQIEKRNFLKWFIQHQQLKRLEARKVIEYILSNFHILEKVSFTEKIILNGRTIVISSMNSDEPGFLFYYNQQKTDDVSKALGDLMMNPYENVYIVIHFSGKMLNHRYLQLIENPVIENIKQYERFQKYEKEADGIIEKLMLEKEIETIKKQIDEALDQKDAESFNRLTARMKELNTKQQNG